MPVKRCLAIAAAACIAAAAPAVADSGRFLHVSDIHFDPFVPSIGAKALLTTPVAGWAAYFDRAADPAPSRYGSDTNHALYESSLAAIAAAVTTADFAIVTGDLLSHRFPDNTESVLGLPQGSAASNAFAVRTTLYVLQRLKETLPGKPVFVALGNNDSSCGDYRIDPGGSYLAATREAVRDLPVRNISPTISTRATLPGAISPRAIRPWPARPSWSSTMSCGPLNMRTPAARAGSTPPMP